MESGPEVESTAEKENSEIAGDSPVTENQTNGEGESQVLEDSTNDLESEREVESETVIRDQEIDVNENRGIEEAVEGSSASEISDPTN